MAEELELTITNFQRCHVQGIFYRQNVGFLSLHSSMMTPCYPLSGPYAAITYRLGIVKRLSDEIWSCDMTPTADGFIVNNGEYFITIHISPPVPDVQDHNFHLLHESMGVITVLLPSTRPQMFEITVQLFSTNGGRDTCVSYIKKRASVPSPRLEEYQEGPGIEYPIKKHRPNGMWSSAVGMGIVKHFQRLADDGTRVLFMEALERLEKLADRRPRFIDLMPLALYELAMLDLHENRIEEAKQHAKKALEISKTYESTNHRYLLSKLKYVKSALARRGGNYAEAKELLDDSVELLLPCAAGEETAENRYFIASYYVEKSAKIGITDHEEATTESCFDDVEHHLNAETRPITNRFQIRSKNRQVAFYVKSSRHVRNLDAQILVSEQHMEKAFTLIREIEDGLLVFYPKKPLLSFDIVKTDYYIRRGNFEQGIAPSEEALMIAREKQWREYEHVASERLKLCRRGRI